MPPAGPPGHPPSRSAGNWDPSPRPGAARLSPRLLPASRGAAGCRVPAPAEAARGPEFLRGQDSGSRPAPCSQCDSPGSRARLPGAAGRAAAPVGETRPPDAPSGGDTGPPPLLASPAAPSAAREPGYTARGRFTVCPQSAGAAPKLRLGVNCRPHLQFFDLDALIHVSDVKGPRSPTLGRRNVLYKCFVEGVLSAAKIRWWVI